MTLAVYDSPQVDMGYDISNYKAIHPPYGTLEDVNRLITELKKRDMKLVMDLVVNHTSHQHPWFLESKSSLSSPKRDWYIWKKPKYDDRGNRQPPNNWVQILGEGLSAWTYDPSTEEYYLSLFTPEQPDLNWENPAVREAVHDILRFWLDRGVSGFRMDVINLISKNQSFPDAEVVLPGHVYQPGHKFYANGSRLHEYLHETKIKVLDHYDTMTVGETPFIDDVDEMISIVHGDTGFLNMIFYFELMDIDTGPLGKQDLKPWGVKDLRRIMNKWQKTMIERGGWIALYLENHDQPRSLSHFCDDSDEYRETCAKLLALMHLTLSGTVYVYQGQELGMRNVPKTWDIMTEFKDIEAINYWKKAQELYHDQPERLKRAEEGLRAKARDNARTPVQWDASANAGFCPADVKPWMRVNDDYPIVNADLQMKINGEEDPSVWQFWHKMIEIRKRSAQVLVYGNFQLVDETNEHVFAYRRVAQSGETWVTVLNFTGKEVRWCVPEDVTVSEWVIGNYHGSYSSKALSGTITLKPWEGLLGRDGR
ncbi:hypothetical protein DL546_004322 [Coniochaeta pulveracea]|uniref:Glycosyl hydrolase family 13 catalytic domain-containing protein n=1 Tax=Coniochaeta pulveracea TaxID=177199 RepID=A0A420Y116_9PEZI|nr:hypothetical protein DL546_004322 [Coniochaeta pulveracea]